MGGAFQTSRNIFKHEIWQDVVKFRIFFYIVGNAVFSHEGIKVGGIHVKRGQFLRSLRNLQDDLMYREGRGNSIKKYPLTTIQRKIKSLEKEERITTKSTENGTLFTVVNYDIYQGFEGYQKQPVEQKRNSDGTVTEQRWNKNKKEKNVKKEKNDKTTTIAPYDVDLPNNAFNAYQMYFGKPPSPFIIQQLNQYLDAGMEHELIALAFYKAIYNGQDFLYARGILNNWEDAEIYTIDQAWEEDQKRLKKSKGEKNNGASSQEIMERYKNYSFR